MSKSTTDLKNARKTLFESDKTGLPLLCNKCLCSACKEPNCSPCVDCINRNKLTPVKGTCNRRGY